MASLPAALRDCDVLRVHNVPHTLPVPISPSRMGGGGEEWPFLSTAVVLLKAGLYQLGSRGGSLKKKKKKSQAHWEPLSASWSQPAWSSGCPTGTHCTPPKPHELATQLPVCSVHLTQSTFGWFFLLFLYIPVRASPYTRQLQPITPGKCKAPSVENP